MNIPKKLNSNITRMARGRYFFRVLTGSKSVLTTLLLMMSWTISSAADVTLTASDSPGTSSFMSVGHWDNSLAPGAGNAYFTGPYNLRTTNYVNNGGSISLTFGGDSLSIDSGGRLLGKIGNNGSAGSATTGNMAANYVLNGGIIDEAGGASGNDVLILSGTVTINAASFLGASGATSDNSANFETLEIAATISGSADLQVSGQNVNGGADTGVVKLSAANPYSGTITVPISRTANAAIASAVNRMLQLNNLDAVSNATLNLTTTNINPVSFAAAINTGPFNVGALVGNSSQALSDTSGSAITLSVGARNTSTTYSGGLSGNGSLTKVGRGILTLSGTNTYTGGTTVKGGTLEFVSPSLATSSTVTIATGAILQLDPSVTNKVAGLILNGVYQPDGIYNSNTSPSYFAGAGSLAVTNLPLAINSAAFNFNPQVRNQSSTLTVLVTPSAGTTVSSISVDTDSLAGIGDSTSLTRTDFNGPGLQETWVGAFNVSASKAPGNYTVAGTITQSDNYITNYTASLTVVTNVTLTMGDPAGLSSLNSAGQWNIAEAPTNGNAYFTGNLGTGAIRTPSYTGTGNALTFVGDSLSIDSGARFIGKIGNSADGSSLATVTITNLILNGGYMDQAGGAAGSTDFNYLTIAGGITVNAASSVGAFGAASPAFETLEIASTINGSAALQVSGTINSGNDYGLVKLSAANPYSGTITVTNASNSSVFASSVNRVLQLNNLDALSNATLNLVSVVANPVSFASEVNSGPFNVGALSGSISEVLSDTAGSAVNLSVGGNNASSSYSGALSGNGSLTKVGNGTLTLSGINTYTGNTTISNGTVALTGTGSISSSNIIVASGAIFDVSSNAFTLAGGQSLLGNGTVNGSVTVASAANIYAGLDTVYGTNTFTTNLTFLSGSSVYMDLSTAYNGANDKVDVGGNLTLNNVVFHIKAPSTSVNLDQTADYTLMTVAGTTTGSPAATPMWEVPPLNANHYSIAKSGNNIVLHYNSSLLPSGYGSISPNPAVHNQGVLITVTVTYSATPVSSVMANATALGGSSAVPLISAGDGTYTNTVIVASGVTAGDKTLTATITDSSSPAPLSFTTPGFTVTIAPSSQVWSGGGTDNNWSSNPNWQSGSAPGYMGDAVTLAGTTRLAPDMNANYSLTGLTFDGTAGNFVLGSSSGYTLTLSGDINDNSSTMQTLNLSVTNTGNTIHIYGNNDMAINGGMAGAGGLEDDISASTLVLTGTNSFTGGINITPGSQDGTLQIGGAGLLGGTNGIYVGNITNNNVFQYSSSAVQTLSGGISSFGALIKDGSGKLILGGNNTYTGSTYISNGVLQVTGTLITDAINNRYTHNIIDNGTLQWSSSAVQGFAIGVISGTGGLIMDGSGTLNINNTANTYSGDTIANGGTLAYNPNTVGYSTSASSLVINGGGTVLVNANNNGQSAQFANLTMNTNGVLKLSYDFSGGNPGSAAVAVSGNLSSPGTNIIQINGYGAANTQFPLISYGTLSASMDHFILSLPPGMSGNLVNNTINHTIDLNVTGTSPATWIPLTGNDGVGTSSFNSAGQWQDGNQPTAGNGYYTQGNVLRSPADANDYTFAGSALSIDQYGFGNSGGRLLLKGSGTATLTVTNLILNGGLLDYANGGDNGFKTMAGYILLNNGTTSYLGALAGPGYFETLNITAAITGGGNLQIGGGNVNAGADYGVVQINATNTYTGATTIATGALLVNGSIGGGAVTVNTNATLGGSGFINSPVTVLAGGALSPGIPNRGGGALVAAIGTLTVNNTVTLAGSASMKIDRGATTNSDKLVASSVIVSPGATLTVSNLGSTNLVAGDTFTLFSTPVSGSFTVTNLPSLPSSTLAWTNKLAVDGTIAVFSTSVGPSGPEVLTNSYNAVTGILGLSWPANEGWRLQMQTNPLSKGLNTNWVYVTDGTISSTNISINATNGSVFYRLTYP